MQAYVLLSKLQYVLQIIKIGIAKYFIIVHESQVFSNLVTYVCTKATNHIDGCKVN